MVQHRPAPPLRDHLVAADGTRLAWMARETVDPRAGAVLVCGHGESFYKYAELFDELAAGRLSVYALDPRGQGSSQRLLPDREKGHVGSWRDYVQDLGLFLREVAGKRCPAPLVGIGHSLGGGIIAAHLEARDRDAGRGLAAAVLSCPLVGLRAGPLALAGLALLEPLWSRSYVPGGRPFTPKSFESNTETHSRERHERKFRDFEEHPEVRMGEPTVHWMNQARRMARSIRAGAGSIGVPLLVFQAGEDAYVDGRAVQGFCADVPDCRRVLVEAARHELLIESDPVRARVVAETCAFIEEQARAARC